MAEKTVGITAAGNATYGTREPLADHFENRSNGGVTTKSGRYDPIRCGGKWTTRKKVLVACIVVLLIVVVIIIAVIAASALKSKNNYRAGITERLLDGSGCPGDTALQRECTSGDQFRPYATDKCIPLMRVCDGFKDCIDGEDEEHKLCAELGRAEPARECTPTEWRCTLSLKCISVTNRCNGKIDCWLDFSDEMGCVSINDEGLVEINQKNKSLLMGSDGMNADLANSLCLEIGFQELERFNPRAENQNHDTCYKLKDDIDLDQIYDTSMSIRDAVELKTCVDDHLSGITCQVSTCGTFRNFTGPKESAAWKKIHKHKVDETTDQNFPWIVDILLDGKWKCLGTIIDGEWILTTSSCVAHFETPNKWTVRSGNNTDDPQTHNAWKYIKHQEGNAVLLQIEPMIEYGNAGAHEICAGAAFKSSMACFAAGMAGDELHHVRLDMLPANRPECQKLFNNSEVGPENICYNYTHPDSSKACLGSTIGGAISCFNPEFNSFTLIGMIDTDKIGCGRDYRKALLFEPVERWAFAHARLAKDDEKECSRNRLVAARLSAGNRKNELIVEVTGIGQGDDQYRWFALYGNLTGNMEMIRGLLDSSLSEKVDIIQSLNSDIKSKYTVDPECTPEAETPCGCKFSSPNSNNVREVASFLIYSEIGTQIEDIIAGEGDVFHGEDSTEYIYDYFFPDYEDDEFEPASPSPPPANISEGCLGDRTRQMNCGNSAEPTDCLPLEYRCDGFKDCKSGADEDQCPTYPVASRECPQADDRFLCKYTKECLKKELQCDSFAHCSDGYDEANCVRVLEQGHVQINRRGRWYLVSARGLNTDEYHYKVLDIADEMCQDMGFERAGDWSSQTLTDSLGRPLELNCLIIAANNLDKDDVMTEKMAFSSGDCDADFMVINCTRPSCGTYGKYTGPSIPELWGNDTDYVSRTKIRKEFPWLVEIWNSSLSRVCYGSLLEHNWIITTKQCVPDLDGNFTVRVPGEHGTDGTTKITLRSEHHNTDLIMFSIRKYSESVDDKVYPICVEQDILYDHCVIRAQGEQNDVVRVRILPDCLEWGNETLCFEFLHPQNDSLALTDFHGSPLACLNYLTNSWSLAGVVTQNNERITDQGKAVDIGAVDGWVQSRLEGFDYTPTNCQNAVFIPVVRYQAGSRRDTYYVIAEYDNKDGAGSATGYSVFWEGEEPPSFFLKNIRDQFKLEDFFKLQNAGFDLYIESRAIMNSTNCTTDSTSLCDCVLDQVQVSPAQNVQLFEIINVDQDYGWEE